jgi:hypothetical protein
VKIGFVLACFHPKSLAIQTKDGPFGRAHDIVDGVRVYRGVGLKSFYDSREELTVLGSHAGLLRSNLSDFNLLELGRIANLKDILRVNFNGEKVLVVPFKLGPTEKMHTVCAAILTFC